MGSIANFPSRKQAELTGNILPFWMADLPNRKHSGFYRAASNTAPSFIRWNDLVRAK